MSMSKYLHKYPGIHRDLIHKHWLQELELLVVVNFPRQTLRIKLRSLATAVLVFNHRAISLLPLLQQILSTLSVYGPSSSLPPCTQRSPRHSDKTHNEVHDLPPAQQLTTSSALTLDLVSPLPSFSTHSIYQAFLSFFQ